MVNVSSEIGRLRRVLVHHPDMGIDRISPKRAEELLFDDIVYLPKMRAEHTIFTAVLEAFLGKKQVLRTEDLLKEALEHDADRRQRLIEQVYYYEELPKRDKILLEILTASELSDVLITGYYAPESACLFDPIPNFLFTRDIAVTVNDHVIITKAAKEARFRENLLTRFIFSTHPAFQHLQAENRIINLNDVDLFPPSRKGGQVSLEGGDMMIINEDYLLVGCSERSTAHGIELLKEYLFEHNVVRNVVQINLSKARSWMHIDTVFTHIHHHHIVAYKPLVIGRLAGGVQVYRKGKPQPKNYFSIADFLTAEINPNMDFIFSGNDIAPYDEREQWTDGCNLVALKPGVALAYDRNVKTAEAFQQKGYDIVNAEDFLLDYQSGELQPQDVENTIITLPSSELSRARGGSHCMTCPIWRDSDSIRK